jgi:hypothetical protein
MNANKRIEGPEVNRHKGILTCEFDQINAPGSYVEQRTGTLLRVPEDALVPGRSPVLEVVTNEPWVVSRISDDPFLPLTKARMLAADLDLYVNF